VISHTESRPGWITSVPSATAVLGNAFPAADLGGTNIRVMLLSDDGSGQPRAVARSQVPTRRGLAALIEQLEVALADASRQAAMSGYRTLPLLAIGSPGRIEQQPDSRRVIAARSATNLEAFAGELDGVDLAAELSTALAIPRTRVFWDNDAVVQGRFLIAELLQRPSAAAQIRGHELVCIHPGTGLGGCVAAVLDSGTVTVFTDSHISELSLHPLRFTGKVGAAALAVSTTARAEAIRLELTLAEHVHTRDLASPAGKQAEDFIAGSGIELIARELASLWSESGQDPELFAGGKGCPERGIDGALLSQLLEAAPGCEPPAPAGQAARFVADLAGVALARLIRVLHSGEASKTPGFPDWSQHDMTRLRGVSRFVLGGGITKTRLGCRMIARARTELHDIDDLHLFEMARIADGAGVIGAFFLIPDEIRQALSRPENP
jgi:hypothetical protein